jgi:hypothetical protein
MSSRDIVFVLKARLPLGVGKRDFLEYAVGEIRGGVGGLRPEDPLFGLDRDSVKCVSLSGDAARVVVGLAEGGIRKRQITAALRDGKLTSWLFKD